MSSITKSTPQHSVETTTKKKFGKNLNKLTKPPAPAASSPQKASTSSRNGLLLLSTKRATSSANAAASSGGILSNKSSQSPSKPLPALGLQYESNTSTHDALLGAVNAASRAEAQQPDAWGVADKQQKSETSSNMNEISEVQPEPEIQSPPRQSTNQEPVNDISDLPSSNWDEYGGRNIAPEKLERAVLVGDNDHDNQGLYMARRARERADKRRSEEESRIIQQKERAYQRLRELDEKAGRTFEGDSEDINPETFAIQSSSEPRTLFDPNGTSPESKFMNGQEPIEAFNRQPMIQLSSYDDRDRGERGSNGGPRMLFDPKSGSMVTVHSRDDATNGKGRKERGKKGRNSRDKDTKPDNSLENDNSKVSRKPKPRRDDNVSQQRGKVTPDSSSPNKVDSKKGRISAERNLPRTCGVLYLKDSKGQYISVDETDGDLSYGAHSVPGGKTRNPDAYENYVKDKKQPVHEEPEPYEKPRPEITLSYKDTLLHDVGTPEVSLQTGFDVPEPEPVMDWINPSLMTGIADSPTLQATAKEWAPSHAALSAAAAASNGRQTDLPGTVEGMDAHHEEDDHAQLGLGFDPTLNMDSMMQSPSAEPTNHLNKVDFTALSLEPAMQVAAQNTHNIFAFDSRATWGAGNAGGGGQDLSGVTWGATHAGGGGHQWGMPSAPTNTFVNNDSNQQAFSASFLLSSSNTWGGVNDLSGNAFGGPSLNGKQTRPTGD